MNHTFCCRAQALLSGSVNVTRSPLPHSFSAPCHALAITQACMLYALALGAIFGRSAGMECNTLSACITVHVHAIVTVISSFIRPTFVLLRERFILSESFAKCTSSKAVCRGVLLPQPLQISWQIIAGNNGRPTYALLHPD